MEIINNVIINTRETRGVTTKRKQGDTDNEEEGNKIRRINIDDYTTN